MSTNVANGFASDPRTSFSKSARPTPTGTAKTIAVADVTSEPKMNGNAPKDSRPLTGFQSVPTKNPKPNCENVRFEPWRSSRISRTSSNTSPAATIAVTHENPRSSTRERRGETHGLPAFGRSSVSMTGAGA